MSNTLPLTKGKLSSSITLYASTSPNLTSTVYENYGSPLFFDAANKRVVGGVTSISRVQPRTPERIYELGKNAFEPNRVVPTPITTDLILSRVVLYDSDALEELGYSHGNLFYQQNPFLMEEVQWRPILLQSDTTEFVDRYIERSILYFDCWLTTNPIKYDIMNDDQLVMQNDINIICGKVRASDVDQVLESSRTVDLVGGAISWVKKLTF